MNLLFASSGIIFLLILIVKTFAARERNVGVIIIALAGVAFVLISINDGKVLLMETLYAVTIWIVVFLLVHLNRKQNISQRSFEDAYSKIKMMNEEIETRVAQRVQELNEINQNLHHQIEERLCIENELLNSQRLYNAMARNFPNGLIGVLNKELRYIVVDGMELIRLKQTSEMLIGQRIFDGYPEFNSDHAVKLFKAFDGENVSFDIHLSDAVYNVLAVALPDHQWSAANEILVVISNITQRKKLEEDLHRAIAQEKELVELKSRFVTMASHEFRTPLGTMLSSVFLLERYNDAGAEDKRAVHINRIKKTINNLTEILNDFLALGKLEENKVQVIQEPTDIENAIHELINEIGSLKKPEQQIVYTAKACNGTAMLDTHLINNILINLISNAIKYSPVDGVVKVISERCSDQLTIYVSDQGLGIPEDEQPHIFERFFRSKNAVNVEGTGLGLHIVKKYVELMRGSIDFSSNENGTTFRVTIPIE